MKSIFLIMFSCVLNFCYSQDIRIELLRATKNTKNKILLALKIYNQSDKNYVINNNFTFEEVKPDFSFGTFVKFNLFENDTIKTSIPNVHFEKEKNRNYKPRKCEVFYIKGNSKELINICLDDFLSEAEKIGLKMKMIAQEDLSINLVFYQSSFKNIEKRKILAKMYKENYTVFKGQISTNKVHLN